MPLLSDFHLIPVAKTSVEIKSELNLIHLRFEIFLGSLDQQIMYLMVDTGLQPREKSWGEDADAIRTRFMKPVKP